MVKFNLKRACYFLPIVVTLFTIAIFFNVSAPVASAFSCPQTTNVWYYTRSPVGVFKTCNQVCADASAACVGMTECPPDTGCLLSACNNQCGAGSVGCECNSAQPPCTVTNGSIYVNSTCTAKNGTFTDSCVSSSEINKYICNGVGDCALQTQSNGLPGPMSCHSAVYGQTSCVSGACNLISLSPPPGCGDGTKAGAEVCDSSASPTGCTAPEVCNSDCSACVAPSPPPAPPQPCGNAAIDANEACDFSASPSGCGAGQCNAACNGCLSTGCAPNTCNPPNQHCLDGQWFDCSAGATCSGAGVCGVPFFDIIFKNPTLLNAIEDVIPSSINWLLGIASSIVILFLVVGGIIYISAAGDEERIQQGKRIVTYAIFGLVIILIAYGIVALINRLVTG